MEEHVEVKAVVERKTPNQAKYNPGEVKFVQHKYIYVIYYVVLGPYIILQNP